MTAVADRPITKDEVARLRRDFPYFCERLLWINPKIKELVQARDDGKDDEVEAGPLIRLVWNEAQREVWRIMCEQIRLGRPLRFAVLKARQVGISTFFCAYIFWMMWRQMHTRAAIVAFEKKTTLAELNLTIATFWDNLPAGMKPELPQGGKSARVGLGDTRFHDRKSRCKYVVQKRGAGRGIASDIVLCTEVSFYEGADEFFGGFVPAMGTGSAQLLVMESSPEDGYFKDKYVEYKADGVFKRAIFIPWWMVTDLYQRALEKRGNHFIDVETGTPVMFTPALRKKQRHLSREAAKIGRAPITDEQMWWWRHFCDNEYGGDEEWMQQEFPDDDVTAFQKNSRSAFKMALPIVTKTTEEVKEVYPNAVAGWLRSSTYTNSEGGQRIVFEQEPEPDYIDQERRPGLVMLEPPRDGFTYVIGADVADDEGEDDEEGERAFSVGRVYCCNTREEVAWWRGHIDPYDWGDELVKMGYFWNEALLICERNNMGRLTEHRIRELRYPVHKRFRWPDWNVGPHALTKKEMWETNESTKMLMIGSFRRWVRDGLYIVRDPMLHYEMSHYRVVRGKFKNVGAPADRIISGALCVMGVEQTEFAYRNIVLGGNAVRETRSAHGAALRILRESKSIPRPSPELPEEFEQMGIQRVTDIWAEIGL
jgi:hypothetical protein